MASHDASKRLQCMALCAIAPSLERTCCTSCFAQRRPPVSYLQKMCTSTPRSLLTLVSYDAVSTCLTEHGFFKSQRITEGRLHVHMVFFGVNSEPELSCTLGE